MNISGANNGLIRQLTSQGVKNIDNTIQSKTQKAVEKQSIEVQGRSDEIKISEEGKRALEIQRYAQIAKKMPSVREEEIERVQQKINNNFYSSKDVLEKTAERILGA